MNSNISILGFKVSSLSINTIVTNALENNTISVVNTINPHSYIESKTDRDFHNALQDSDVLIPDGSGVVLAAKVVNKVEIGKIAGTDLFYESMKQLSTWKGKVFFLGSSDNVLKAMSEKAMREFPNVSVQTLSPPYKEKFNQADINSFVAEINNFKPDVLFVGLTAPKQEKLIHQIKSQIDVKMVSGIGAVFDFYAGAVIRPHPFWLKLHLEWLVRLIGEPKRLWRRNFISTPLFLLEIFLTKLGLKKFS